MAATTDDCASARSAVAVERHARDAMPSAVVTLANAPGKAAPDVLGREVRRAPTPRDVTPAPTRSRNVGAAGRAAGRRADRSYLTVGELCARWDCSRATLYRWIRGGYMPRPVRFGPRAVRWAVDEIEALEEHLARDRGERP